MSKLENLDLTGVVSLAAVTAALLVGWIATSQAALAHEPRKAQPSPEVTLTPDGRMKLEVVAPREEAVTLTADGRMKLTVVGEPADAVALTEDGRMQLTVTADPIQDFAAAPATRSPS